MFNFRSLCSAVKLLHSLLLSKILASNCSRFVSWQIMNLYLLLRQECDTRDKVLEMKGSCLNCSAFS